MPRFQLNSGPISIAASTTKTLADIATPAGAIASVAEWWVGSDATSAGTATSAIRIQIGLFSAAVTTHSAYTPDLADYGGNGLASQVTAGINTTVEGAGTATHIREFPLGLTQSMFAVWETVSRPIPASSFWRIRAIIPAGIGTTNLYVFGAWDE
jgi:hypothetical protein